MNTETQRPTPETSRFMDSLHGYSDSWEQFAQKVEDFSSRLERERDEAREQIQMMLKHDATRLESDSIVGSCDCLTKTPELKYHKPGCKYRILTERDEAREQLDTVRYERDSTWEQLEAMRETIKEAYEVIEDMLMVSTGYLKRSGDTDIVNEASNALTKLQPFLKP